MIYEDAPANMAARNDTTSSAWLDSLHSVIKIVCAVMFWQIGPAAPPVWTLGFTSDTLHHFEKPMLNKSSAQINCNNWPVFAVAQNNAAWMYTMSTLNTAGPQGQQWLTLLRKTKKSCRLNSCVSTVVWTLVLSILVRTSKRYRDIEGQDLVLGLWLKLNM